MNTEVCVSQAGGRLTRNPTVPHASVKQNAAMNQLKCDVERLDGLGL
jgi:hypothetical protein